MLHDTASALFSIAGLQIIIFTYVVLLVLVLHLRPVCDPTAAIFQGQRHRIAHMWVATWTIATECE